MSRKLNGRVIMVMNILIPAERMALPSSRRFCFSGFFLITCQLNRAAKIISGVGIIKIMPAAIRNNLVMFNDRVKRFSGQRLFNCLGMRIGSCFQLTEIASVCNMF